MRCCVRMSHPTGSGFPVAEGNPLQGCRMGAEHRAGEAGMSLPEDCKPAGKWLKYDGKNTRDIMPGDETGKKWHPLGKIERWKKNYSVFQVIHEWFAEVWLMALWTDVIWSSLQACKETFPPIPEIGTAKSLRKFLITEDLFKILHFHPQSEPLQWFTASCGVWGTSEVRYWIK